MTELTGIEDDEPVLNDLYRFDFGAGYDEEGHARGTVKAIGDGAHLVDLLEERGIHVPPHLLNARKESTS